MCSEHVEMTNRLIVKTVAATICVVIMTIAGCNYAGNINDNQTMVQMVEKGASALEAKCAVNTSHMQTACEILVAKK